MTQDEAVAMGMRMALRMAATDVSLQFGERDQWVAQWLRERVETIPEDPIATLEEAAFKAGYHSNWTGIEYTFDPGFTPGDPDGAYKAWLAQR